MDYVWLGRLLETYLDCRLFYVSIRASTLEIVVYARRPAFSIVTSVLRCVTFYHCYFFLTASGRGSMLSGAQRYLMDNYALLQFLKSVR